MDWISIEENGLPKENGHFALLYYHGKLIKYGYFSRNRQAFVKYQGGPNIGCNCTHYFKVPNPLK